MAYGNIRVQRDGQKVIISIELPERGEPSKSGRAENLVDPKVWTRVLDSGDELDIKLTLCRPYRRVRSAQ